MRAKHNGLTSTKIQKLFHTYVIRYCNTVFSYLVTLKCSSVQWWKVFQSSGLWLRPALQSRNKKNKSQSCKSRLEVSGCHPKNLKEFSVSSAWRKTWNFVSTLILVFICLGCKLDKSKLICILSIAGTKALSCHSYSHLLHIVLCWVFFC